MGKSRLEIVLSLILTCSIGSGVAQFSDVTRAAGVEHTHIFPLLMGGGAVFLDYNNDGFEDLCLTGGVSEDHFYFNKGDGTFENISGILPQNLNKTLNTAGVIAGDYDNDGCTDLFFTTIDDGQSCLLLKNDCSGKYIDVSQLAGISEKETSLSAVFLDVNADGFLDIYVTNYIDTSRYLLDSSGQAIGFDHICAPNFLYLNKGDGSFEELSQELNAEGLGCALAVASLDYNFDRLPDIYIANDFGEWIDPNVLLEHQGTGFADLSEETGLNVALYGMGIAYSDLGGDGDFDLYVTNLGRNALMRCDPGQEYRDITTASAVENTLISTGENATGWGCFFFDFDLDTDEDLFVSNGYIPAAEFLNTGLLDPNKLYINEGNYSFADQSETQQLHSPRINRGAIFGDYDLDGDLDVVTAGLSRFQVEEGQSQLFRNDNNPPAHWLLIDLVGTQSNPDGFGSTVSLYAGGKRQLRQLNSGGSHASQHSRLVHFGLGANAMIDSILVQWPSGRNSKLESVPVNQKIRIIETSPGFQIAGCTDPENQYYDPAANYNTNCRREYEFGCTDVHAENYDPAATVENGTCQYTTALSVHQKTEYLIYPNVVTDYLYLRPVENSMNVSIRLMDIAAQVQLEVLCDLRQGCEIGLQQFPEGIYNCTLLSSAGTVLHSQNIIIVK